MLICGGKIDVSAAKPPSLREAVARMIDRPPFDGFSVLLAEHLDAFFPRGDYEDILTFENDFAQLAQLVVVISESYGSAAEIGAFAMIDEVARRILVVIDDENYNIPSYIKLGPIRYLENKFGGTSVFVLHREDIGIKSIKNVEDVNSGALLARLGEAISARRATARDHSALEPKREGHVVKLAVGLIQHYGALTETEIAIYLDAIGVQISSKRLDDLLLCAEFASWIVREKRGLDTYFVSNGGNEAISYKFKNGFTPIGKDRWRALIAEHWRATDSNRFNSIQSVLARAK